MLEPSFKKIPKNFPKFKFQNRNSEAVADQCGQKGRGLGERNSCPSATALNPEISLPPLAGGFTDKSRNLSASADSRLAAIFRPMP